jgi:drug/metabolite transporter (DMT)-like permease
VDATAAVLALVAAVLFALAAALWQRASLQVPGGLSFSSPASVWRMASNRLWLLGLGAQVAGVLLQAAALDRGRVSIIQPLLVTSIVFALPIGHWMTGQRITRRLVVGAALTVAGLAVFGVFGDPAAGLDDAPAADWAMAIVVIVAVCAALLLFSRRGTLTARAALLGTLAGVLYGLSATLMKPVVEAVHADGLEAVLTGWQFWVMAVAGLVGFAYQQLSLSTGRLVPSVASVSVANPVVSVILGALVLRETLDRTPEWHAVLGLAGLGLALFGAMVIASKEDDGPVPAGAPPDAAAAEA